MWLGVILVEFDGKGYLLDKRGNLGMRVKELTRGLHLFDIPDDDGGKKMDACTGQEFFAQEREIAEGVRVVASSVDDLLDYFRRERGGRR